MTNKKFILAICIIVFLNVCIGITYASDDLNASTSNMSMDQNSLPVDDLCNDIPKDKPFVVNKNYPVTIKRYNVDVNVNENNVLDIKETITIHCNIKQQAFFKFIPLVNHTKRADGIVSTNLAQVSNVTVSGPHKTYVKNGFYYLEMPITHPVLGEHTYVISYSYNLGKPVSSKYDELYFNIIGADFSMPIENVSFSIKMPHDFDHSKIGFTSGQYGSNSHGIIPFTCNNNVILGHCNQVLNPGQALTIRCELPKGYFVNTGLNRDFLDFAIFIVPIVFVLISFLLLSRFSNQPAVDAIEFYPPDGLNSLDVALLYNGTASSNDVTSLLVYLANKGYIKIVEHDKKTLFSKSSITLVKLKEYTGSNENERIFLDGLFENNKTEVELSSLQNKFYRTINKILSNVNSLKIKLKIFDKSKIGVSMCIATMALISYCLVIAKLYLSYGQIQCLIHFWGVSSLGFFILFDPVMFGKFKISSSSDVINAFIALLVIAIPFAMVIEGAVHDSFYFTAYIINFVALLVMFGCFNKFCRRSSYGLTMLGKILGFKRFLKTAEGQKLEALVFENPSYFFDIMPYTYVLGVSDKWIKKFETISFEQPKWYSSNIKHTNFVSFGEHLNSSLGSANNYMTSKHTNSWNSSKGNFSDGGGFSDGGFSGGGFSGQGFGGGGGGTR